MLASSVSVGLPTLGQVEQDLQEVEVIQEEYRHEVASYLLPRASTTRKYRSGTPVTMTWVREREASTFFGYVHHVETEGLDTQLMRVWCKAASTVFDNGAQYVYQYRTAPQIISEIARSMGFNAAVEPHGRVFDRVELNSDRVWDQCVELGKEIGYSFYVVGTTVFFHPRLHRVNAEAGIAPVLRYGTYQGGASMTSFTPMVGAAMPGQDRRHNVLTGVDPRTGYYFQVEGGVAAGELGRTMYNAAGKRYRNVGTMTPLEARWKLHAMAENQRFNVAATATAKGSPKVRPTSPVQLDAVDEAYEGLWFVRKVAHRVLPGGYIMDLDLGRDAVGTTGKPYGGRGIRPVALRGSLYGRPRAVEAPPVLVNDQWRSQWTTASRSFSPPPRRRR